jgi:hypothetical protein
MATKTTRRSVRRPQPVTDQRRFDAVFASLTAAGVAYWFDLRGATGVREDRYNDYMRVAEQCGTDLWVGEHVGNVDCGGAYWGTDGVLYGGHCPNGVPYRELWFSFNHEHLELAELLVHLFREQGIDAWWSGEPYDCVIVNLAGVRSQGDSAACRPAIGR